MQYLGSESSSRDAAAGGGASLHSHQVQISSQVWCEVRQFDGACQGNADDGMELVEFWGGGELQNNVCSQGRHGWGFDVLFWHQNVLRLQFRYQLVSLREVKKSFVSGKNCILEKLLN